MAETEKAAAAAAEAVGESEKAAPSDTQQVKEEEVAPTTTPEVEVVVDASDKIISQSVSFKEETNVVTELPDPQKKALDDLKQLIRDALNNHQLTPPPPPPPKEEEVTHEENKEEEVAEKENKGEEVAEKDKKEEEVAEEEERKEEVAEKEKKEEVAEEEEKKEEVAEKEEKKEEDAILEKKKEVAEEEEKKEEEAVVEKKKEVAEEEEEKKEEEVAEKEEKEAVVEENKNKKEEAVGEEEIKKEEDKTEGEPPKEGGKSVEAIQAPPAPPLEPEEVEIWGIPLLVDDRSDVILLKFLRARDFKVKDAFTMLKNTIRWRKDFGIDSLVDEDLGSDDWDKVVFTHGFDKLGHPVCYNVFGELYNNTFSDEEKRQKFIRWRIQLLEKSVRKLEFNPSGISTIVQVNDLKNSPGLLTKRDLRQVTNQALQLLQDNYPELVAKQVFINVPWWYLAFSRMISAFLTQRTKSKFVFAGPSKSAETLFKYIAPELVPVKYGGLSREGEHEFTSADPVTEATIKPATKHTVEFPVSEKSHVVWEVRVVGWDVNYGAEFVPSAEEGYTVIVQKSRKIVSADETVISNSFKVGEAGKVVLTIDNQTSKKKKLLYRFKTKPISE